ncbi:hypothetical protein [Bythopirellula polymerisocia]|uniref:Uncharacterized protein n=1 Tax=Bythopirellula polymerisocia TaxID=2528003 RepID=A0A5C6CS84_9BACT|nr:hypothetical protein [Bythopirellula polymerisocia]TWU27803.1 hypothetical protein Pla144_25800 [Bythopirellula polymerisocia]
MGALIRFAFPLIGFLSTATVITALGSYGYLRNSGKLDDEKVFRIVAIMHDVDLDKIAKAHSEEQLDVPREEDSFERRQEASQMATLQLQAKRDDLIRLLDDFDSQFKQLSTASARYQNYKTEVEHFLTEIKQEALDEGLRSVREQIQNMNPKKQAKPLLIKMLREEDRMHQVILILNGMSPKKRSDIIKTFEPEDLDILADLHRHMLDGDPVKPYVENQLNELNKLKSQDNL